MPVGFLEADLCFCMHTLEECVNIMIDAGVQTDLYWKRGGAAYLRLDKDAMKCN